MGKRQCQRCCVVKAFEDFKDTNKYCERCLEKEREKYQKNREKKGRGGSGRSITEIIKQKFLKKGKNTTKSIDNLKVFCDFCQCKVKKCRWSKHLQTEKHKHNETVKKDEEEKVNKMTDEEKDEYYKIKKLKQIWKTVWLRG